MKKILTLNLLLLIVLLSCKRSSNNEMLTCEIFPIDFIHEVNLEGTVDALRSTTLVCPRRVEGTLLYLVKNGTQVVTGDTVCIIENRELQSDYEESLKRVEKRKAELAKSKADLQMSYAMLEAQVKTNEAQTAITNLDSLQLQYSSDVQRRITALELKKASIEKRKIEKKLKALEVINKSELRKLELQIKRDENRAERVKAQLDEMVLTAPQDGIVKRARSWLTGNEILDGDQVWGNMPIVDIPDLTAMKVVIWATESQYRQIAVGNHVEYLFDAMTSNVASGKITSKAPMGKPISRNSKIKVFEIVASVDSFQVIPDPGLSAKCQVIVKEIKDTIVVPQISIFDEDSIKAVFVKQDKNFERHEVLVGESSVKYAVIVAGLKGDECISLIKPKLSQIKGTIFLPDSIKSIKNIPSGIKSNQKNADVTMPPGMVMRKK